MAPSRPQIDNVLLKALARAFRWQSLLDRGVCGTIKEIAAEDVEMILDGRQPPALQFECLRKSLPLLWEEQRSALAVAEDAAKRPFRPAKQGPA